MRAEVFRLGGMLDQQNDYKALVETLKGENALLLRELNEAVTLLERVEPKCAKALKVVEAAKFSMGCIQNSGGCCEFTRALTDAIREYDEVK